MFGKSGVEIAPYEVLKQDGPYEVRHYESLILVTTPMQGLEGQRSPFSKLFNYITGENETDLEIPMTAPVFMDQKNSQSETMSFVLPKSFSFENAPKPQDPSVILEEIKDYTVAAVIFNGRLQQDNIRKHRELLEQWMKDNDLQAIGPVKAAGYNPPFTIPAMRRNEVLIPVQIKK